MTSSIFDKTRAGKHDARGVLLNTRQHSQKVARKISTPWTTDGTISSFLPIFDDQEGAKI